MENIIFIGAHFDDVELGAGGTAAKLASKGKQVFKLTLTDNVTNFNQMNIKVEYEKSKLESNNACKVLCINEVTNLQPIACNHLVYSTETMQRIEEIIYKYNIDTVFCHYSHDFNQDHVEASKLCITAARHCKNLLTYQSNLYTLETQFTPTIFFDISDVIDKKKAALDCYGKEHNRFNKLFEASIDRCKVWGFSNKCEYAEGFHVIRMLIEEGKLDQLNV